MGRFIGGLAIAPNKQCSFTGGACVFSETNSIVTDGPTIYYEKLANDGTTELLGVITTDSTIGFREARHVATERADDCGGAATTNILGLAARVSCGLTGQARWEILPGRQAIDLGMPQLPEPQEPGYATA